MLIAEIVRHPKFELVGVGVSNSDKVGRDVAEICGIELTGVIATDDLETVI
jgi:2,4-diaminopentanoate dehydrogenase